MKGIVPFIGVTDNDIVQEFGVKAYPTMKVVVGNAKGKPHTVDYKGARKAKPMAIFALEQAQKLANARIEGVSFANVKSEKSGGDSQAKKKAGAGAGPSDVVTLTDADFNKKVLEDEEGVWLVKFYAPWCGHCTSLAPAWEEAATKLKGKVHVARLDATKETQTRARFDIKGFPTLLLFPSGPKSPQSGKPYQGPRNANEIVKFASKFASATASVSQLLSQETFTSTCGKGLCIIAFIPHILDSALEGRMKYLNTLNDVVKGPAVSIPVNFLWSQGGDQLDVEEQLNLKFGWPAVIAVNLEKQKFAIHRGDFGTESLSTFLTSLVSGLVAVAPLPSPLPTIKTVSKWEAPSSAAGSKSRKKTEEL
eukprot:GHVT01079873.1.p1 GENE.GHVT01079873.1~~GHVT01079873.1.p1  ORF type:complete len:365 (-),score=83.09 GHVT01079873.1:680-1774(-)